jgi:hypothetical protein
MPNRACAQADVSASQQMTLSAFAGVTYTFSGLYSNGAYNGSTASGPVQGKSTGITGGVDLRVGHFGRYNPTVEVRGSYPVDTGNIDSAKDILAGFKLERPVGASGRLHPYVDLLVGRGELDYHSGGYLTGGFVYFFTDSTVLSPGAGVDIDLTHHFALKLDAQYQQYKTPVVNSGKIWSLPVTAGVIYIFDFNQRRRR